VNAVYEDAEDPYVTRLRRRRERRGCFGKKRYPSHRGAIRAKHRLINHVGYQETLSIYECEFCQAFHLGNTMYPVRRKEIVMGTRNRLRPLPGHIVVVEDEADTTSRTSGGLFIPDSARDQPTQGVVKAVGKDIEDITPGERIIYKKYGGSRVKVDDTMYLILKVSEVSCVVED
jgi:chaperonin GroES